jgi:DNA polymerase elongation subunit (family B)
VSGRTFELTKDNYLKYIKEEKLCKSDSDILFSQKRKGIMPEFLDFLYTKRKEMKSKMISLRREYQDNKLSYSEDESTTKQTEIQKYDTFQHAYKITLNSTYGYCANKYAPLGDDEIGASVTLTGQAAIKQSIDIYMNYLKEKLVDYPDLNLNDYYIYSDTDSDYLSFKWVDKLGISFSNDGVISKEFYAICDEVENIINVSMDKWARRKLWSSDPRFVFKRESICDHGIFIGKKYYVLHMKDDEGIPVDKFKYKGVDVVKTTMPKPIKPHVKNIIETMIMSQSLQKTNDAFLKAYEIFKGLGVESIYKNSSVNNYEKYFNKCSDMQTAKGMPAHAKAAYYHDIFLDKMELSHKYEKFKSNH